LVTSLDESPRKLAEITTIKSLSPIEGADRIEAARFTTNGWVCVTGKSEFKVGDKAVFFSIDACLPKESRYAVLEGRCNKALHGREIYRLRTIKLRSQISQGLAMPISAFPEIDPNTEDGTNVTDILGVKLWIAPVYGGFGFNIGRAAGGFPTHLCSKTDQNRLQSMSGGQILNLFRHTWESSEKIDGTSISLIMHNSHDWYGVDNPDNWNFYVCSRNMKLKPPGTERIEYFVDVPEDAIKEGDFRAADGKWRRKMVKEIENPCGVYYQMAEKYAIKQRLEAYCQKNNCSLAIQGECVGPGIQKNRLQLDEIKMFIFDIWNVDSHRYLSAPDRYEVIKSLNEIEIPGAAKLQHVPIIDPSCKINPFYSDIEKACEQLHKTIALQSSEERLYNNDWPMFIDNVTTLVSDRLIEMAAGKSAFGDMQREGVVYKSLQDPMVSFKLINNDYLLQDKD